MSYTKKAASEEAAFLNDFICKVRSVLLQVW